MQLNINPVIIMRDADAQRMKCPACGKKMKLHHIEPVAPRFDLRTFECAKCEMGETFVVEA